MRLNVAGGVRQYCNYINSCNLLHMDESYARRTRWGGIVCPGPYILRVAAIAPGLPGVSWLWGGVDFEWRRPVRVGDIIAQRGRLIDAYEKRGANVSRMLVQVGEFAYTDQLGERVATARSYTLRVPRSKGRGGLSYTPRATRWTDADIVALEDAMLAERVRGGTPRYWEDVRVGDELSPLTYGPLRTVDIAFTRATEAEREEGAHVYPLLHRRRHPGDAYQDPETGAQDAPHRGHWEAYMARAMGMPGIYDVATQRIGWLYRLVADWADDDGFVQRLGARIRRPNVVGDVTRVKGCVVKKARVGEKNIVECDVWIENEKGDTTTTGKAVVALPSRG